MPSLSTITSLCRSAQGRKSRIEVAGIRLKRVAANRRSAPATSAGSVSPPLPPADIVVWLISLFLGAIAWRQFYLAMRAQRRQMLQACEDMGYPERLLGSP
ncbi:hypothetical protein GCM10010149_37330 [Nonomuraea roseoviolacea subsp. roseoviolacea]